MRLFIEPIDLSAESKLLETVPLYVLHELRNPERNSLKGSHKIFQLGFFVNGTSPPRPRIHKLNHFRKQQRIRRDFLLFHTIEDTAKSSLSRGFHTAKSDKSECTKNSVVLLPPLSQTQQCCPSHH